MKNKLLLLWLRTQKIIFLKNQSLMLRMLIFSALLVIVPLTLVGIISYRESSREIKKQARDGSWQIIEQVRTHVEYYITGFEIDSIKLLDRPEIKELLLMDTFEEIEQSGIRTTILKIVKDKVYSQSDISKITIILDHKTVISTDEFSAAAPVDSIKDNYWYDTVPNKGDIKLVSRIISIGGRQEPVISMVKRLIHPVTLEPVGMLLMDINFKRIQEISDKVTIGRTGYLSIIDKEGYYMYHPHFSVFGKMTDPILVNRMKNQENGFFQLQGNPDKYITFGHSPYLNWYIVTTYPSKELFQGVKNIQSTITWTVVSMLSLAYVLGLGFATSLVRPIRRLQRFISKVKNGNLKARAIVESQDEIGQLAMEFNNMVERLGELLDEIYISKLKETEMSLRQSETELKMLQSQLNPHFLFNSLETIRGMALEKGMKDISAMSSALAMLLRYNLNNHSPYVTLKEEIAVCEMYLRIQKFRFEDKIQYQFHIPVWALELKVLKFSLQPLVENCVVHGVEPGEGLVRIIITAEQDQVSERLVIRINDTGGGISEERLASIQLDLLNKDILSGGSHIGIVNVHRRIVHLFGDYYGLEIRNYAEGTEVKLFFPELDRDNSKRGDVGCIT